MNARLSILLVNNDPIIEAELINHLQNWQCEVYAVYDNMLDAILAIPKGHKWPDFLLVELPLVQQRKYLSLIRIFQFLYPISVIIMSSSHPEEWGQWIPKQTHRVLPMPFSEIQLLKLLK